MDLLELPATNRLLYETIEFNKIYGDEVLSPVIHFVISQYSPIKGGQLEKVPWYKKKPTFAA